MKYGTALALQIKQAGVLQRTGELTTYLLNRMSGKARLGHQLLNAGISGRLNKVRAHYTNPSLMGEALASRTARLEGLAGKMRDKRLGQIGAGTLGLGGVGLYNLADEAQSPEQPAG